MTKDQGSDRYTPPFRARLERRLRGEADWFMSCLLGRFCRFPNDQALRIFAMRRSGHHAIVNWICHHLSGKYFFLNDCKLGFSPFESAVWPSSVVKGFFGKHHLFRPGIERQGMFTYKGTLIFNYEEADLSKVPELMDIAQEKVWIGPSRLRRDILILRDPFNLLASKLKWAYGVVDRPSKPTLEDVRLARDLWKIYAREFLDKTRHLRNRICISYNQWFADKKYRDQLAASLGFENRDLGVKEVAKWGPTLSQDSFDGLKFEGRAQEMRVLERWKVFEKDPFFLDLISDGELQKLSYKIFGEINGTGSLF